MHIYSSNRLEILANTFADLYTQKSKNAFIERPVVVQSQGMARWLKLFLADKTGISLNFEFLYPRNTIIKLVSRSLGFDEKEYQKRFFPEKDQLVWPIYHLLAEMSLMPAFKEIQNYLSDGDPFKRLQLSFKIASLFDEYLLYRPEWVLACEQGNVGDCWQAQLWLRLWQELGQPPHLASLKQELGNIQIDPSVLPESIHLFGLTTLPPLYLEFMQGFSKLLPLHFYLMQASGDYWSDMVSKKTEAKAAIRGENIDLLYTGNPLLGSLGKQGRDLINLLMDHDADFAAEQYTDIPPSNCLKLIQHDIFNLIDRSKVDAEEQALAYQDSDHSILVHNCHGPMRELECLQDYLLECFEELDDLEAKDILILCPDLETYAPYINAVFGTAESDKLYIPYSIADRKIRSEQDEVDTFLRILELADKRVTSRDISELLQTQTFCQKFNFSPSDLDRIKKWIAEVGVRWGIDANHLSPYGMESFDQNTWRSGLRSLLAGFAMRGNGENLYEGLLPHDEVEGQESELLGRFVEATEYLLHFAEELAQSRTREQWSEFLNDKLKKLLEENAESLENIKNINSAIEQLSTFSTADEESIPASAVQYYLSQILEESYQSGGFLQGKVSFAELKPLRSVPARVICLLGMDFSSFPKVGTKVEFDLIQKNPRLGDRSARDGDRYLFLESLLSARERLLFSYSGQSVKDNSQSPVSVLVSELLDYLNYSIEWKEGTRAEDNLVREHKIHGFNKSYFESAAFHTYSKTKEAAANARLKDTIQLSAEAHELKAPDPNLLDLNIHQLIRFFKNPTQWFLQQCLEVKLVQDKEVLDELELFNTNPLTSFTLKQNLSEDLIESKDISNSKKIQCIQGNLPLGHATEHSFDQALEISKEFNEKLKSYVDVVESPQIHEQLTIGPYKLSIQLSGIHGNYLPLARCSKIKNKDLLNGWITHLAILACDAIEDKPEVILIGEDKVVRFDTVENPTEILMDLLQLYWKGQQEALAFFPDSSFTFVETTLKQKDGIAAAIKKWKPGYKGKPRGEAADTYFKFFYDTICPMEDSKLLEKFIQASISVYKPLLEALNEEA